MGMRMGMGMGIGMGGCVGMERKCRRAGEAGGVELHFRVVGAVTVTLMFGGQVVRSEAKTKIKIADNRLSLSKRKVVRWFSHGHTRSSSPETNVVVFPNFLFLFPCNESRD